MRLTDEQIMDIKEYLNRSIKITISSLIPRISKHGLDLIDTIEALQQENEQLRARVVQSRKALTIVSDYYSNVLNMAAWKTVKEALAAIDKAIGGKEDV